jgi:cysteine dioxygenase
MTTETTRIVPVQQLIVRLGELADNDFLNVEKVLAVLRTHPVDPESLAPYLFWNPQHYTRNLVHKTAVYELLAICWEVGMRSSIHNHKNQNCWMAAPIGKLKVNNYQVLEEDLQSQHCDIVPTDTVEITAGNPVAVDPLNPVHDVRNPREWNQRAVSLHLYSRPFDSCIVYSCEQHTCGEIGLCYTSMYGELVHGHGEPGPD